MTEIQPSPDPAEVRAQHRFEVLRELADIGMGLAREVGRQAAEASAAAPRAPGAPAADLALQFSRIARAVRQTVALEAKLDEERRAVREEAEAERAEATRLRGLKRKNQAGNIIEHMLDELDSEAVAERLSDSLRERLEDADDGDFADRPVGEIVAAICRDLGVTIDWSLWEDEPWAADALKAERAEAPDAAPPPDAPWRAQAPPGEPPISLSG